MPRSTVPNPDTTPTPAKSSDGKTTRSRRSKNAADANVTKQSTSTRKAKENPVTEATTTEKAETPTQRARREREEAEQRAREAKIAEGLLIVRDGTDFERSTKQRKTSDQIAQVIEIYRSKPGEPLPFAEVVKSVGATYPEDLIPCMYALTHLRLVEHFRMRMPGRGRTGGSAFRWVG